MNTNKEKKIDDLLEKILGNIKIRYAIYGLLILLFVLLLVLTIKFTKTILEPEVAKEVLYNETGKINYSVCLKENAFISDNCISEKRSFVTTLIDHLNIDFEYIIDSSDLLSYTYSYDIIAKTTANEKGDPNKVLYVNEDRIFSDGKSGSLSNNIVISKQLDIDFQKYNSLIINFKKNYVLSLDSNLDIIVNLKINGTKKDIDEQINNSYSFVVTVPIAEQTVNITKSDDISNSNSINQTLPAKNKFSLKYFIADILYTLDAIYIISLVLIAMRIIPILHTYKRELARILHNYDGYIVNSSTPIPFKELQRIELKSFNELLDARTNLEKPIIFYENQEKGYSIFAVLNDNTAFIYILKNNDKKNKNIKKEES